MQGNDDRDGNDEDDADNQSRHCSCIVGPAKQTIAGKIMSPLPLGICAFADDCFDLDKNAGSAFEWGSVEGGGPHT